MNSDGLPIQPPEGNIRSASPARLAFGRFAANRMALVGLGVLLLFSAVALLAPILSQHDPNVVDLGSIRQPPSAEHILGTDMVGRDVASRLMHAGRVSIRVGLVAALTATTLGLGLGVVAGMKGGSVDTTIMRFTDAALSFPTLIIVIVFAGIFGPSVETIILAIALLEWPTSCRVVRSLTLSLREQEFVLAARSVGLRESRVVIRHIVPAVLAPLAVVATLLTAHSILIEAALSFLGLGVQPPQASWGNMMEDARSLTVLTEMPWLWIPPGVAIAATVLSINFIGDGLRDVVASRS